MKRFLLLLLVFIACNSLIAQKKSIIDRQLVKGQLPSPGSFEPIPKAKDSYWRITIPHDMRSDYIKAGHRFHGKTWDTIPNSVFSEYRTNGNRANYERLSFGLRRRMLNLVLGEIMEYKGILIEDILKGLDYFKNETWWGSSAHYPKYVPDSNIQIVDLFNAETSNLLAWTIYMLEDELEKVLPGITNEIRSEIERRFLIPARTNGFSGKNKVENWNTWICANWLSCTLLCEIDRNQQIKDIEEVLISLEDFYNGYHRDGGCEEGANYWDRSAASLFECIRLLELATKVKSSLVDDTKLREMGSFIYKYYIGDNVYVNFADAPSNTQVNINILYPYGKYIGDTIMTGFSAMIAEDANYQRHPTQLLLKTRNSPSLSRELFFLSDYKEFERCEPSEPLIRDVWLPDLQVFTARSKEQSVDGLYVAAKGGNNAENHNHNDVGSFIVYADSNPLIIDLGVATYNGQTFSKGRYELMNCRSAYHNVPLINGFEQYAGSEFRATNVNYSKSGKLVLFSLNLEKAYPKEAAVEKWKRTIKYYRGKCIEICEDYSLSAYYKPTEIILISREKPVLREKGQVLINLSSKPYQIKYNPNQLTTKVEEIRIDDASLIGSWHTKTLYRIHLVVRGKKLRGLIRYTIQ